MHRITPHLWLLSVACTVVQGCLPTERINASCSWDGDTSFALDVRDPVHRKHLELDVRLAEDLGIRYGDAVGGRVFWEGNYRPREQCTETLLATVRKLHGVTQADLDAATGARDVGIDLITVFIPVLLLFAATADWVTRRIDRTFEPDERWMKLTALVVLALVVAALGVMFAGLWAWAVEAARLRNSHISYRVSHLPTVQHRLTIWITAVVVFGCVALARDRLKKNLSRSRGATAG